MIKKDPRNVARKRRQQRIRRKVSGTAERPRLSVYRSQKNIYAQLIDDHRGHTLAFASTLEPELAQGRLGNNSESAQRVGESIARKAKNLGINSVVFDRSGYLYHGRIKALAEGARKEGLEF